MKRLLVVAACAALAVPAFGQEEAALREQSRAQSIAFQKQLAGTLLKEMEAKGPEAAIAVCKTAAPAIANEQSARSGARVSRVSLKVRNPMLGMPDAWEQRVLLDFEERLARGEKPDALEFAETVSEPQGRYFRYMRALPVAPLCTSCHGTSDAIPDPVKARLASDYPADRAIGYVPGQIRGAITIKRPL